MNITSKKHGGLPRIAAIHDLSCFGRCALTVVVPTLSAMGFQVVPIPTALLSTHTGGFENMYFEDLTDRIDKIADHLDECGVTFDAIYTGFLASEEQVDVVLKFIDRFAGDGCLILVDPVMGDNGRLYSTYTKELANSMKRLCKRADIITPNLTEACILSGTEYESYKGRSKAETESFALELCQRIAKQIPAQTVLTGLHYDNGYVANYVLGEERALVCGDTLFDADYPGTGDLFASVLLGHCLRGATLREAAALATKFTRDTVGYSLKFETPLREGVAFEALLGELAKN